MKHCSNTNINQRLTANALKEMIASFLLSRDNNGTIGYEVMYGSSRRVADMVFISKGHSYAIEIKSEFDTTNRLENQLQEYQLLFDYILIFTAPKHLEPINAILPKYVGLYSISESGIQQKKREKINRHVLKSEMLISIPSAAVKNNFSIKGKLTSDEIRSVVMKMSYKSIHNYFISYYIEKLSVRRTRNNTKVPTTPIDTEEDYIII
ncbi:MAG: sce7726 family protein [Alistipes shahii]|uniref:sce7726 family protein n=1 Tax=Alistipes shahii TaxID=328814 RepID=UPI00210AAAF4|nr:sce7726 family protein [Alistipes shahii]MCQ5075147.1 sce7726 family protein [Alistipes shahii]